MPSGLGDELETDFEPGIGLNTHVADEGGVVGLERIGGVVGSDPREQVQRLPGEARERRLEPRAADLLTTSHVARRCRNDHASLDELGERVDLRRVVAAVGHRHNDHGSSGVVDPVTDRKCGTTAVGVECRFDAWITRRERFGEGT